jgi:hypothetical protein
MVELCDSGFDKMLLKAGSAAQVQWYLSMHGGRGSYIYAQGAKGTRGKGYTRAMDMLRPAVAKSGQRLISMDVAAKVVPAATSVPLLEVFGALQTL